jgi:hypothetical protein
VRAGNACGNNSFDALIDSWTRSMSDASVLRRCRLKRRADASFLRAALIPASTARDGQERIGGLVASRRAEARPSNAALAMVAPLQRRS